MGMHLSTSGVLQAGSLRSDHTHYHGWALVWPESAALRGGARLSGIGVGGDQCHLGSTAVLVVLEPVHRAVRQMECQSEWCIGWAAQRTISLAAAFKANHVQ